jgi:hypothetical protein
MEAAMRYYYRIHPLRISLKLARRYPLVMRSLIILSNGTTIGEIARQLGREAKDIGPLLILLKDMGILRTYDASVREVFSHTSPGYAATHHYGSRLAGRMTRPLVA